MIPISERNKVIDNIIEMHGGNPQVEQFLKSLNGEATSEFAALLEQITNLYNDIATKDTLGDSLPAAVKDPRFQGLVDNCATALSWERKVAENICVWLYFHTSLCALEISDAKDKALPEKVEAPEKNTETFNPFLVVAGYAGLFCLIYYLLTLF